MVAAAGVAGAVCRHATPPHGLPRPAPSACSAPVPPPLTSHSPLIPHPCSCLITYTSSTTAQDFAGADSVVSNLGDVAFAQLAAGELSGKDDRVKVAAAAAK